MTTTTIEKIHRAAADFVRGGDERNVELLDRVLHPEFHVSSQRFMGKPGVVRIDKQQYLANIREGIFGGVPRKMTIESTDESEAIAMVKLRLESAGNHFVSYNSFVLDTDGEWKLIHNLAIVESKTPNP